MESSTKSTNQEKSPDISASQGHLVPTAITELLGGIFLISNLDTLPIAPGSFSLFVATNTVGFMKLQPISQMWADRRFSGEEEECHSGDPRGRFVSDRNERDVLLRFVGAYPTKAPINPVPSSVDAQTRSRLSHAVRRMPTPIFSKTTTATMVVTSRYPIV